MFELEFRPKALKSLRKVERKIQLEINSTLDNLKKGKFDLLDIKTIAGKRYGHRLRVGRWRILFSLLHKEKRIEVVDLFLKKGRDDYQRRTHLVK